MTQQHKGELVVIWEIPTIYLATLNRPFIIIKRYEFYFICCCCYLMQGILKLYNVLSWSNTYLHTYIGTSKCFVLLHSYRHFRYIGANRCFTKTYSMKVSDNLVLLAENWVDIILFKIRKYLSRTTVCW